MVILVNIFHTDTIIEKQLVIQLWHIPTAKVGKNSRGTSQRNFFILSTFPDPLRCLDMSTNLKTNDLSRFRRIRTLPSRRLAWRLILFSSLERKCRRCELRRVLDHYFNVCLGVSGRETELTRTCCFGFDRKRRPDSKRVLLPTFCFYLRVVWFTPLPRFSQVDKK